MKNKENGNHGLWISCSLPTDPTVFPERLEDNNPGDKNHTPTPWEMSDDRSEPEIGIIGAFEAPEKHDEPGDPGGHKLVAEVLTVPEMDANVKFLLAAVNSHDELLDACRKARQFIESMSEGLEWKDKVHAQLVQAIAHAEAYKA